MNEQLNNNISFLQKLRLFLKRKFDSAGNRRFRKNLLNAFPFWAAAFISGAVAVLYAKLFALAEAGTRYIFIRSKTAFFLITPACFLLAWWLTIRFAPFARGSGIPQVSAAIELSEPRHHYRVNALLGLRIIFVKIISSLVMVFGGGAIGREGPTIQISASIFKKINDFLPKWYPKISKCNMIVTGAAAGLAAAFNTPLGGIVFAIEELTKTHFSFFKSALLTGVIIAGLTALNFLGPYLYLGYPHLENIPARIFVPVLALAVATGIGGSGMGGIILYVFKVKNALKKHYQKILFVIFCGLAVAAAAVWIDADTFGSGKDIMVRTLFTDQKHLPWYSPLLRFFGPIFSFSAGASGGIFAPSLSAGACMGAVFSGWLQLTGPETNLLILCGMTGFLTSITRSPFTSSILVLEMTNSHNVIFYIMLTALVANLVATTVSRHSLYDRLKDSYVREIHETQVQEKEESMAGAD